MIPSGGQIPPIQILGFKLEWKYAQNKQKKNIISETKKSINPTFKPF